MCANIALQVLGKAQICSQLQELRVDLTTDIQGYSFQPGLIISPFHNLSTSPHRQSRTFAAAEYMTKLRLISSIGRHFFKFQDASLQTVHPVYCIVPVLPKAGVDVVKPLRIDLW